MKVINVVGARPNLMKIAALIKEMKQHPEITSILVHTGQHYDENMSKLFFPDLQLSQPDIYLGVGSDSQAVQTAKIMVGFEEVLLKENPDLVVVVGDVNSTIACALVAVKINIPVAHVEAGLRSFDRNMPEEINRILTDAISDYLFVTEKSGEVNLLIEGRPEENIFFVGNIMIDTLLKNKERSNRSEIQSKLNVKPRDYALLTLHRPSNVDIEEVFVEILEALEEVQNHIKIVFPVHPRTRKRIEEFDLAKRFNFLCNKNQLGAARNGFIMIDPLGYLDFLKLMSDAKFVFSDSGGIQEETTVLGVPCLTIRKNTERPVTVEEGTNVVVGTDKKIIIEESHKIINTYSDKGEIPYLWDGKAAQRIVEILFKAFHGERNKEKYMEY